MLYFFYSTQYFVSHLSSVARLPGAEVPEVARAEGPPAPAGDGGVPTGHPLRSLLCSGEQHNIIVEQMQNIQKHSQSQMKQNSVLKALSD